ncbi:MAG: ScaI family restriction endonuclease [Chloroflexi bacterium]|nr:ScaI family restriction endonuclease [Chloroflexota bacterium]
MISPYDGMPPSAWRDKTLDLIQQHPLKTQELYDVTRQAWEDIFQSKIGSRGFRIGIELFPAPQIMGFFLHELIALEFQSRYPNVWRRDQQSGEKDMVYIPDEVFSIEIKTSSSAKNIYGNRSYTQMASTSKKSKSGYYLAVNFEKFSPQLTRPQLTRVRFGWLDHSDWVGQSAATGQQARLSPEVERYKLIELPLSE